MTTQTYTTTTELFGEDHPVEIWYEYEPTEIAGMYQPPGLEQVLVHCVTIGSQPNIFGQRHWLDVTDLLEVRQRRNLETEILDEIRSIQPEPIWASDYR